MDKKIRVLKEIDELYCHILAHPSLMAAQKKHCELMTREFNSKRSFYKFIFKDNRFLVSTVAVSHAYCEGESFLADVKTECHKSGMVSANTISSILALLKVTGRLSLKKSASDKRKTKYLVTQKGESDTLSLVNTVAPMLKMFDLNPESPSSLTHKNMASFFRRYSEIHSSGFFLINLVADADVFITRDSGHIIMMNLFMLSQGMYHDTGRQGHLIRIAEACGISKSHLRNTLLEAEKRVMITYNHKTGDIDVLERFDKMFASYMSYYLSFVQYGLNGIPSAEPVNAVDDPV